MTFNGLGARQGKTRQAGIVFVMAADHHGFEPLITALNTHSALFTAGQGNPPRDKDVLCANGMKVSESPFWEKIREDTGWNAEDPLPNLMPSYPIITKMGSLNKVLNVLLALAANEVGSRAWKMIYESAERFYGIYDRFLTACQTWYPHRVFVDGERSVLKCMVVASMGFPVKGVIHLVRDPRGYALDYNKDFPEVPPEKVGMDWAAYHQRVERLKNTFTMIPFVTVKYEDLIEKPEETLKKLFKFMGLKEEDVESPVSVLKTHLIGVEAAATPVADRQKELNSMPLDVQKRLITASGTLFKEFGYKE